jgi:hypothetical protein
MNEKKKAAVVKYGLKTEHRSPERILLKMQEAFAMNYEL